jgi:hypothetical protein
LQISFRLRSEVQSVESPGNLELTEIRRIDLVERRIVRVAEIRSVSSPFSVLRSRLPEGGRGNDQKKARAFHG